MTLRLLAGLVSAARFAPMICGLVVVAACSNQPRTPEVSRAPPRIAYSVSGQGAPDSPTVVLQSGLGDDRTVWRPLIARISKRVTVFSYDRPGYGASPARDTERDACSIAREQRELLAAAGVKPPYILVGHSLGGLYQFVYAKLYPAEVAGVVLLDPTHPQHWQQLQAQTPLMANFINGMRATQFSRTMRREFDAQSVCLDSLDLKRPLTLPARLLTRSEFSMLERGRFQQVVTQLATDWARLTGAPVERVNGSGHYLQKDRPDEVAGAIIQLASGKKGNDGNDGK